jgi:uncharacterized membrane protein (UPF0127 family)
VRLYEASSGRVLAERLETARSSWARFRGLMGRAELPPGGGLWLEPCNSIHMFFMRFPIDAVFLDKRMVVKRVIPGLRPWRLSPIVFGAKIVVELPAGTVVDRSLTGSTLAVDL